MVFVNRGNSLGGLPAALRAMSNVRAWARRPKRLHFHLLADEQQQGAVSAMTTLGAQAGLPLTVHNASDAALQARLPPLGLATLHHAALQGKPRLYTAPKLFLHALLDLQSVLVIDTDILVMADVCELWDAWIAHASAEPRALLGYAREQQVGLYASCLAPACSHLGTATAHHTPRRPATRVLCALQGTRRAWAPSPEPGRLALNLTPSLNPSLNTCGSRAIACSRATTRKATTAAWGCSTWGGFAPLQRRRRSRLGLGLGLGLRLG